MSWLSSVSFQEREEVSRGLAVGISICSIAFSLGRGPSIVSREIGNGVPRRRRAADASLAASTRALRSKKFGWCVTIRFGGGVPRSSQRTGLVSGTNPGLAADISRDALQKRVYSDSGVV
ncbi:helix-turn-helix domain-containing protein [Pseudomonas sp. NP21570]|uniref:helix-turn-helix domain-containing protein n=1 Tax=Stutzerimonas kunmingensis TaxID=1211807 RepID=UPI0035E465DD|nr:helix-turn-helix domain-containing protein [Pseudomonas sp. NP21570]